MQQFIDRLTNEFNEIFPKGYISVREKTGLTGHKQIDVTIGLIKDINFVKNKIRYNDPMHHIFIIYPEGDKFESRIVIGGLLVNSTDPRYCFETIPTKFRKTAGDIDKTLKVFNKCFAELRNRVDNNIDKLCDSTLYHEYI